MQSMFVARTSPNNSQNSILETEIIPFGNGMFIRMMLEIMVSIERNFYRSLPAATQWDRFYLIYLLIELKIVAEVLRDQTGLQHFCQKKRFFFSFFRNRSIHRKGDDVGSTIFNAMRNESSSYAQSVMLGSFVLCLLFCSFPVFSTAEQKFQTYVFN